MRPYFSIFCTSLRLRFHFRLPRRGQTARALCRHASCGPTLVNGFESGRRDAVVGLEVQPHLVAHAHDEVGDAGAREPAQEGNGTALCKVLAKATFTCGAGRGVGRFLLLTQARMHLQQDPPSKRPWPCVIYIPV